MPKTQVSKNVQIVTSNRKHTDDVFIKYRGQFVAKVYGGVVDESRCEIVRKITEALEIEK